jgi:hypothetical protein
MVAMWVTVAVVAAVFVAIVTWASWGSKRRRAADVARLMQRSEADGNAEHRGPEVDPSSGRHRVSAQPVMRDEHEDPAG